MSVESFVVVGDLMFSTCEEAYGEGYVLYTSSRGESRGDGEQEFTMTGVEFFDTWEEISTRMAAIAPLQQWQPIRQ